MKGMLYPYSKEAQIRVKAGTKEAEALLKRSKPSKYKNRKTVIGAETYDSKLEADFAMLLESEKAEGLIQSYRRQVNLKLVVNGILVCKYYMDFVITHNDGRLELVETKGCETQDWRNKWKLTKALLPKGEIEGIPKDSKLTLVKRGKRGEFVHTPQVLNYE